MLTDIQQKLLQLMKELDKICRDNGIHYTLGGGTAIGAIRHKGFIPWDDDIDLYMTRDNWEKFKAVYAAGGFPANRVIESAETDICYTNTIGRYVATDSSSVHSHQIIYNDPAGHVLDVFVCDPLNVSRYRDFIEDFMLYSDLMDETKGYSARFDVNLGRYPKAFARCEAGEKEAVIGELVESFTHMDDPGWRHYIMEWGSAFFLFPASIFEGGYVRVPFEDTTVEIVRNYSEYLTWQYGDEWMYVPQHSGREGHDAIFSNTIPYTAVRADYMPFIDAEKVRAAYIRRKKRLLKANPHRRSAEKKEMEAKAMKCRDELMASLEARGLVGDAAFGNADDRYAGLRKMADEGRYAELSELFEDYYDLQLSPEFSGRKDKHSKLRMFLMPCVVPVDQEVAEIAAETLLRTERMSKAKRLIDIYTGEFDENIGDNSQVGYRLDGTKGAGGRLAELRTEILETRALVNDWYDLERRCKEAAADGGEEIGEVSGQRSELSIRRGELLERASALADKYPKNGRILRLKLRLLLEQRQKQRHEAADFGMTGADSSKTGEGSNMAGTADAEEILSLLNRLEEMYPEGTLPHGEILKYKADFEGADTDRYLELLGMTNNGSVQLEIRELLADKGIFADDPNAADPEEDTEAGSGDRKEQSGRKKGGRNLYSAARSIYRKIAGRDDRLKDRAWEIALRTKDRVELLEKYEDRLDELKALLDAGDLDRLTAEMAPHERAVLRNLEIGLGLSVHPELSAIQYELFRRTGREDLAQKVDSLVPQQHHKPIR